MTTRSPLVSRLGIPWSSKVKHVSSALTQGQSGGPASPVMDLDEPWWTMISIRNWMGFPPCWKMVFPSWKGVNVYPLEGMSLVMPLRMCVRNVMATPGYPLVNKQKAIEHVIFRSCVNVDQRVRNTIENQFFKAILFRFPLWDTFHSAMEISQHQPTCCKDN